MINLQWSYLIFMERISTSLTDFVTFMRGFQLLCVPLYCDPRQIRRCSSVTVQEDVLVHSWLSRQPGLRTSSIGKLVFMSACVNHQLSLSQRSLHSGVICVQDWLTMFSAAKYNKAKESFYILFKYDEISDAIGCRFLQWLLQAAFPRLWSTTEVRDKCTSNEDVINARRFTIVGYIMSWKVTAEFRGLRRKCPLGTNVLLWV